MNVLDENITRDQADLLSLWRIRHRSISRDLHAQGISDENIIPLLLRLKKPTFFTRDFDFFDRSLPHSRYAIVWLEVDRNETAYFIRRFLRDSRFSQSAQRLGKVIRVHPHGIDYWFKSTQLKQVRWL